MGVFDAADGKINLAASTDKMFKGFCQALDVPELADDPRYRLHVDRINHRKELTERMNEITGQSPTVELVEKLNEDGVPCGPLYNMK